jgi:tetratricopeptide (TPR) repeat protein
MEADASSIVDAAVLEALELPLNGPRRFWLGFVFADDRRLAVRARELADEVVRGRGRTLEAHVADELNDVEPIARAVAGHDRTESSVWVDWSTTVSDRDAVERGLAMLNTGRTRLSNALHGGLVIVLPAWAEAALAQGAVDLWSGGEFALRLGREHAPGAVTPADLARAPGSPQLWRRLAPTAVLRALREEGTEVAGIRAEGLLAQAGSEDRARLEAVAAGVALERGDREGAAARALAVLDFEETAVEVLAAAIEVAAAGASDHAAARERWRRGVDAIVAAVAEGDADGLLAIDTLGEALRTRGDHEAAITLAVFALARRERVSGGEHPDTLSTRNNLANAYLSAGRVGEAIALYEPVLAVRDRVLGGEHPDTLGTRNNLALAYRSAGRVGEAIALHEPLLVVQERVLGGEHPDTLRTRNNLANAYLSAGRVGEAIALYEPLLAVRERVLGGEHPDTLRTRNNLALAYLSAGRVGEAIALHEPLLGVQARVLGGEHPETLSTRNNLANAYLSAGRVGEAIALYEPLLVVQERVLGGEHPGTLSTRGNVANAYLSAGHVGEAITLYEPLLGVQERVLGGEHPETLGMRNNLASAYWSAGRVGEAIALFEPLLVVRERVLGVEHPETLRTRGNVANAYLSAGRVGVGVATCSGPTVDA